MTDEMIKMVERSLFERFFAGAAECVTETQFEKVADDLKAAMLSILDSASEEVKPEVKP